MKQLIRDIKIYLQFTNNKWNLYTLSLADLINRMPFSTKRLWTTIYDNFNKDNWLKIQRNSCTSHKHNAQEELMETFSFFV